MSGLAAPDGATAVSSEGGPEARPQGVETDSSEVAGDTMACSRLEAVLHAVQASGVTVVADGPGGAEGESSSAGRGGSVGAEAEEPQRATTESTVERGGQKAINALGVEEDDGQAAGAGADRCGETVAGAEGGHAGRQGEHEHAGPQFGEGRVVDSRAVPRGGQSEGVQREGGERDMGAASRHGEVDGEALDGEQGGPSREELGISDEPGCGEEQTGPGNGKEVEVAEPMAAPPEGSRTPTAAAAQSAVENMQGASEAEPSASSNGTATSSQSHSPGAVPALQLAGAQAYEPLLSASPAHAGDASLRSFPTAATPISPSRRSVSAPLAVADAGNDAPALTAIALAVATPLPGLAPRNAEAARQAAEQEAGAGGPAVALAAAGRGAAGREQSPRAGPSGGADDSVSKGLEEMQDLYSIWRQHDRHFFVLSDAGKPIYARHAHMEGELVRMTAVIQAILSTVMDQGDQLYSIHAGRHVFVFLARGPLYLAAVSACGDPATTLRLQLELLYNQLLFVLTDSIEKRLLRQPSFDAQVLMPGISRILDHLLDSFATSPAYFLRAFQAVSLPAPFHRCLHSLLSSALASCGALYGLLLASNGAVVSLAESPEQPPLDGHDLLLLLGFVHASAPAPGLDIGELFAPVCLPHLYRSGFLHACIRSLPALPGLTLALVHNDPSAFQQLSTAAETLESQLTSGTASAHSPPTGSHSRSSSGVPPLTSATGTGGYQRLATALQDALSATVGWTSPRSGGPQAGSDGDHSSGSLPLSEVLRDALAAAPGMAIASLPKAAGGQQAGPPHSASGSVAGDAVARASSEAGAAASSADGLTRLAPVPWQLEASPLWHFLYKSPPRRQYIAAQWFRPLTQQAQQRSLLLAYAHLHSSMWKGAQGSSGLPYRLQWRRTDLVAQLGLIRRSAELYATFDPLVDTATAQRIANALIQHLSSKRVAAQWFVPLHATGGVSQ